MKKIIFVHGSNLFEGIVIGSKKSIALAIDGWISTSSYGIHSPMCVVIVHHMKISMPTSTNVTKHIIKMRNLSHP